MFPTATIYIFNSFNLAITIGPITLLRILQEVGYRGDGPKKSMSCLNK